MRLLFFLLSFILLVILLFIGGLFLLVGLVLLFGGDKNPHNIPIMFAAGSSTILLSMKLAEGIKFLFLDD